MQFGWRVVLLVVGVALLFAAAGVWYKPPTKTEFAPQAVTITDATKEVDDRSETGTILLIALGVIAIVVAANGRKLASVTVGEQTVNFQDAASKVAGEKTKEKAKAAGLSSEETQAAVLQARADAYELAASLDADTLNLDAIADSALESISGPST